MPCGSGGGRWPATVMPLIDIGSGYCRRIARASGSNFYYALWFLPPARREAMFAVYSFCRVVDDVVDGPLSVEQKSHELSRWRQEVEYCCIGWPAHPVGQAPGRWFRPTGSLAPCSTIS